MYFQLKTWNSRPIQGESETGSQSGFRSPVKAKTSGLVPRHRISKLMGAVDIILQKEKEERRRRRRRKRRRKRKKREKYGKEKEKRNMEELRESSQCCRAP